MKRAHLWELVFALLVAATALPLWLSRYLPIQDLPQHLAAIRVLHSYADPHFDFSRYFELGLWRTQYLAYYLAVHWLAYVFELELANRLLVTACMVATPYSMRALLRALRRDERLSLFALPLAYNAHLILGFVNFLLAIPLAFYGLALCIEERRAPSTRRALWLAFIALLCFYAHIVPFALFALGALFAHLRLDLRGMLRGLAPLLPAGIAGLVWTLLSPAGRATLTAAKGAASGPLPVYQPWRESLADLPNWLTDVFYGEEPSKLLRALGALLLFACVAGLLRKRVQEEPDVLGRYFVLRLWPVPIIALGLYFVAPISYDWIWPISPRFALLALLWLVVVLPAPPRYFAAPLFACVLFVSALQTQLVAKAFSSFDTLEVAGFDRALAVIPPAKRVAGLIFLRGSSQVKFSPFIHYVAYYQARKGGAVMFTFADFPQSPFRFRESERPPRVAPRWEWLPERVEPQRDLAWYDYVLVRGGPGLISRARESFAPVYLGELWSVWKRQR